MAEILFLIGLCYVFCTCGTCLLMISIISEFQWNMTCLPNLRDLVRNDDRVENALMFIGAFLWPITWSGMFIVMLTVILQGIWWFVSKGACQGVRSIGKIASALKQDFKGENK